MLASEIASLDIGGIINILRNHNFINENIEETMRSTEKKAWTLSQLERYSDKNLEAVKALQSLLPPLNMKGLKGHHSVIVFNGENCSIKEYMNGKQNYLTQPFLVALGPVYNPDNYFLILDNTPVPVGFS